MLYLIDLCYHKNFILPFRASVQDYNTHIRCIIFRDCNTIYLLSILTLITKHKFGVKEICYEIDIGGITES